MNYNVCLEKCSDQLIAYRRKDRYCIQTHNPQIQTLFEVWPVGTQDLRITYKYIYTNDKIIYIKMRINKDIQEHNIHIYVPGIS